MADKFRTTKARYVEKIKEKQFLENVKRNEISEQIKYAKSLGDFSENAELDAAKEADKNNEQRIALLEYQTKNVEFVKAHWFKIYNETEDEEVEYTLIGDDSNLNNNEISDTTPLGMVLSTAKVGARKVVKVGPNNQYIIKILEDKIIDDED